MPLIPGKLYKTKILGPFIWKKDGCYTILYSDDILMFVKKEIIEGYIIGKIYHTHHFRFLCKESIYIREVAENLSEYVDKEFIEIK